MTRKVLSANQRLVRRRIRITGWTALSLLLTTIVGFLAWAHVVYPADRVAMIEVFRSDLVRVTEADRAVIITPRVEATDNPSVLVYYPGAKVDPYAYVPTLGELAGQTGLRVVIPRPPLNLALADTRPVNELAALAGPVTDIVVGGHSLGGVRACLVADSAEVTALLLHASYCANDLSARGDLRVLTLLGTQDNLTDLTLVAEARSLLPKNAQETTLSGFNHASFGAYGPQSGDGLATVSREEATDLIVERTVAFLADNN